ncbi:chromosomal replication initiator protein DnaA [bacterium]|nr:chromosomal replication initiator protein DnaA [bacterium]
MDCLLEVENTDSQVYSKIWAEALALLRGVIPDNVYYSWLTAIAVNSYEHDTFYLVTPHQLALSVLNPHKKDIKEALCKACSKDVNVELNYDADYCKRYNELKKKEAKQSKQSAENSVKSDADLAGSAVLLRPEVNLNLKYKFENFVVGENSRMAYAVARTVAEKPAQKYNPLFIYGASGLGKTHLMQAIGHYIIFNKPKLRVKYVKTEEYTNEVISNLQKGGDRVNRMEKFRQKYRNVDVLLLDDIQFLESKTCTKEEIFHTFETLYNNGKQIVLTSDRLPKDIPTLPDRLRTRFEMGIMVELTPPEFETRIAILRNLAERDGLNIPMDVYYLIAENFKDNVRELEGAYNRVSAFSEIDGAELSVEYVSKILNFTGSKEKLTMDKVAIAVANEYGVSVNDFKSSQRNQKISAPRHILVYMLREMLGESYESIAEFLNKKHPTMLYSYEKIRDELRNNGALKAKIDEIAKGLKR